MTSLTTAREAVYQHWVDNTPTDLDDWTFENERFTEPGQDKKWARITVRSLGGGQETLGEPLNRKFRRNASVVVQVFTPRDDGLRPGDLLADEIRGIFEAKSISGLDFNNGTITEIPPDEEDKSIQHNIVVAFDYTEIK